MGKYQAYPEYKESGIEWITEIPSHWHISNIGHESSVKARLGWKGLKADEYVDEGYVFLATPNIKGKDIDFTDVNRITKDRYDESPEIMLQTGDVLVTKDGSTTGTTNLVRILPEPATVNSSIAVLRSKGAVDSNYLFYFFVSDYTQNVITRMRGGMGVPHLFQADLRKFSILVPPLLEQTQIANFLDHETAKIDTLIEKQQQLIKLLKEKRQAVISHAVTKSLNPQAPMKDSGVEWLGEVPEHWGVSSLGYYASLNTGATPDRSNSSYWEGDIPWIKTGEVKYETIYKTEESISKLAVKQTSVQLSPPGTLLMAMYGQGVTRGRVAILGVHATYNQACVAITPNSYLFNEYLKVFFIAGYHAIRDGGNETSQMNLNADIVRKFKVTVPPIDEQKEIVSFLEAELPRFDALLENADKAIKLMQERRTALISAAVTGKIDVREWRAH
ncbi:restriction endonuclease subunit S [Vibrio fluvialis]|nr:restriction endonuclease subunit S [Vibrio fluvialis]